MLGSGDSILVLVHVYLVLISTHGVYATESWGWGCLCTVHNNYYMDMNNTRVQVQLLT